MLRGGQYIFQGGWRGGRSIFSGEWRGGEGFFKVETKVPEEDFSNSIAWSLKSIHDGVCYPCDNCNVFSTVFYISIFHYHTMSVAVY